MPSAVSTAYSVASGATLRGGRTIPPPAWLAGVGDEWVALPNSRLDTSGIVWAGAYPDGADGGELTIVSEYSGGFTTPNGVWSGNVFIPGTFTVLFGSGHGQGAYNSLIAYGPYEADSPRWWRITAPSIPAANNVLRLNGDPVARHSYDTLRYLPNANKMLTIGTPGAHQTGNSFNASDVFNLDVDPTVTHAWSTNDVNFPGYGGGGTGTVGLFGDYNPMTRKAWGVGCGNGQVLGCYDETTGLWSSWNMDNPYQNAAGPYTKGAIDPVHNILCFVDQTGTLRAIDLRTPTNPIYTPAVTGTGPGVGNQTLWWNPIAARFESWFQSGKTLYYLTPSATPYNGGAAWAWTSNTPAGGATPGSETARGTFGRAHIVASSSSVYGVVVMSNYDQTIKFRNYRP